MILHIISPLTSHMHIDIDTTWFPYFMLVQCVIRDYGRYYLLQLRDQVLQAKATCHKLMQLANTFSFNELQMTELLSACTLLRHNDERKLDKWQTRARQQAFVDKGCTSQQFFQHLHHSKQSQAIKNIKLSFDEWTSSLQELAQALESHYGKISEAPVPPTQEAQQARHLFLSHVTPILSVQHAQDVEVAFTNIPISLTWDVGKLPVEMIRLWYFSCHFGTTLINHY